eukprot:gene36279-44009_t
MLDAAQMHGITIQYCMPFMRHMLSSPRYPHVTTTWLLPTRARLDNWRIGDQSLVIYALLSKLPSKDGFWSRSYQPGNPCGEERFEPHQRRHVADRLVSLCKCNQMALASFSYEQCPSARR